MNKYIDAEKLIAEIERLKDEYTDIAIDSQREWVNANSVIDDLEQLQSQIDSLQQKQPEVDLEKEIDRVFFQKDFGSDRLHHKEIAEIARHFYELRASVMRKRITNPEFNQKIIEKMKSEYPMDESNARKEEE